MCVRASISSMQSATYGETHFGSRWRVETDSPPNSPKAVSNQQLTVRLLGSVLHMVQFLHGTLIALCMLARLLLVALCELRAGGGEPFLGDPIAGGERGLCCTHNANPVESGPMRLLLIVLISFAAGYHFCRYLHRPFVLTIRPAATQVSTSEGPKAPSYWEGGGGKFMHSSFPCVQPIVRCWWET